MTPSRRPRRSPLALLLILASPLFAIAADEPTPPTLVLAGHTGGVTCVAAFPDGKHAVTGSRDRSVKIWDLTKGTADHTLQAHQAPVLAVAVSPDGKRVASAGADQVVRIWDPATGKLVGMLQGHTGDVVGAAFLPDGQLLTAGGDGLRRWDVDKEQTVWQTPPNEGPAFLLAVSANGKRAAYFNTDPFGRYDVWDLAANRRLARFDRPDALIPGLLMTPDGRELIAHDRRPGRKLVRREIDTDKVLPLPDGFAGERLALSADGALIATNRGNPIDASTQVWDARKWRKLRTFGSGRKVVNDFVLATAFSPDGKRLLVATGFPDPKDAPPHGPLNDKVLVYDLVNLGEGEAEVADNTPVPKTGPKAGDLSWDELPVRVTMASGRIAALDTLDIRFYTMTPRRLADGLDVVYSAREGVEGSHLYLHRTPAHLEEVAVEPDSRLDDVVFDGKHVWVASRKYGILLFDTAGKRVGQVGVAAGLPPTGGALKLHPLGPGRVLAAGGDGNARVTVGTGWCALVERPDDAGAPRVNVFFREPQLPPAWAANRRGEKPVFQPRFFSEPPPTTDAAGKPVRSVWLVCEAVGGPATPVLRIDPDAPSFNAYNLAEPNQRARAPLPLPYYSPIVWVGPRTFVYHRQDAYAATAGETMIISADRKLLFRPPSPNTGNEHTPFLAIADQLYLPGTTWHRLDPRTLAFEAIGPGLRIDGAPADDQAKYFVSGVLGPAALAPQAGRLYRISVDPSKTLKTHATADPPAPEKPSRRPPR